MNNKNKIGFIAFLSFAYLMLAMVKDRLLRVEKHPIKTPTDLDKK